MRHLDALRRGGRRASMTGSGPQAPKDAEDVALPTDTAAGSTAVGATNDVLPAKQDKQVCKAQQMRLLQLCLKPTYNSCSALDGSVVMAIFTF